MIPISSAFSTCKPTSVILSAGQYRIQAQLLLEYGGAMRGLGAIEGGAIGAAESSTGLAVWGASTAAYEQAAQVRLKRPGSMRERDEGR
jgi:hypothetical protein